MIVLIGPLPPPVHGMSKNFAIAASDVSACAEALVLSTSPGELIKGSRYHLMKATRVARSLLALVRLGVTGRLKTVYFSPDGGWGVLYSLLFTGASRLFGARLYLHHRSFAYLDQDSSAMRWISRLSAKGGCHVFLCERMQTAYVARYGVPRTSTVVSNAHYAPVIPDGEVRAAAPELILGYLSNLSREKGLDEALSVAIALRHQGAKIRLIVAGPPENSWAKFRMDECLAQYGDFIEYLGYVDMSRKADFFRNIDIFLFPSKYKNEAQPNVLFEAASYGVPVIATQRGCVESDVTQENGYVIPESENYVSRAVSIVLELMHSPTRLSQLKVSTVTAARINQSASRLAYEALISELCQD